MNVGCDALRARITYLPTPPPGLSSRLIRHYKQDKHYNDDHASNLKVPMLCDYYFIAGDRGARWVRLSNPRR